MHTYIKKEGYTKIAIWKEDMPVKCLDDDETVELLLDGDDVKWYQGTICLEAQLNVWHCSNYGMVCVRYTDTGSDKTEVIIHRGNGNIDKDSILFRENAIAGLDDEFTDAIKDYFNEQPHDMIPKGRIEILCGVYDEIGSSNFAFRNVMNLISFVFRNDSRLEDDGFDEELFCQINEYWELLKK